jgi:transcriptional/translational regulatory protein YebC/TACO1
MVQTIETTITTKKPNLNKANIKKAIAQGKEMIKSGMSKADVSREIYDLVKDEEKEVIIQVFQQGANLTEKGSLTYLYNIKRKLNKKS